MIKCLEALETNGKEFSQKVKQIEIENKNEKIKLENDLRRINSQNYRSKQTKKRKGRENHQEIIQVAPRIWER